MTSHLLRGGASSSLPEALFDRTHHQMQQPVCVGLWTTPVLLRWPAIHATCIQAPQVWARQVECQQCPAVSCPTPWTLTNSGMRRRAPCQWAHTKSMKLDNGRTIENLLHDLLRPQSRYRVDHDLRLPTCGHLICGEGKVEWGTASRGTAALQMHGNWQM